MTTSERAIELAAEGRSEELTPIERDRVPASELIETYELDEFVERARNRHGPAEPRDGAPAPDERKRSLP
jgi:hypothetical protein